MLTIRDARGRPVLHLDKDDAVPRDVNGKPVGARTGSDAELMTLTRMAAGWMNPAATFDLSPTDVSMPATQADFGIPDAERDFIADQVSAVRFVKHMTGYWYAENVADGIKLVTAQANMLGVQPEIQPGFTSTKYTAVGYALAARIPRMVVNNSDLPIKRRALRLLVDALRRYREVRVANQLTTSTNFASANRVAATAKWNGGSNPAQLTDLFSALKASYLPADTLVLPEIAAQYFYYTAAGSTGAQIRDYVQSGGQLPRILYARAKQLYNGSPAYIWMPSGTGSVPLVRTTVHDDSWRHWKKNDPYYPPADWEPNDEQTDIGSSMTLRWLGEDGIRDGVRQYGVLVRSFTDDTDRNSEWLVVACNDVEIQPSNQVGAIITGAVA